MTTGTFELIEDDTLRVARPAPLAPEQRAPRRRRRLEEMDLEPPDAPVPVDVISYFEAALERERMRAKGRNRTG